VAELEETYQVVTIKPSAIVLSAPTSASPVGWAAAGAGRCPRQRELRLQTLRQVNMQFVIEREDYKTAVKALNMALWCASIQAPLCLASDPRFDRLARLARAFL
jgi:aspartate kinase